METHKELITRLNKVSGQVEGIKKALEQGSDTQNGNCETLVYQIKAARSALKRVADIYVTEYIDRCLAEEKDSDKRKQKIDTMLQTIFNS